VRAYAFLDSERRSYVTDTAWPPVGEWLEAGNAVRACSADELPWWLDEQLWEVELDGAVRPLGRALTASRARLVRHVDAWSDSVAIELVAVCARRVRDEAVRALHEAGRNEDASALARAVAPDEIEATAAPIAGGDAGPSRLAGLAADVVLYARDASAPVRAVAVAAYVAAFALAGGDKRAPGYQEGFDAERRWQAGWLKDRLRL
jgi:hypothetical protein